MARAIFTWSLLVFLPAIANAENWPTWRGPDGSGKSRESGAPTQWSRTENVLWRVPLSVPGNSTPVVWGDQVFLTSGNKSGSVRSLVCYARQDGKVQWQEDVSYETEKPELTHKTNPYGSASPVTNGKQVVAWHNSAGLFTYDMKGKLLWKKELGEFQHIWGYASSPVIFEDLVIMSCGPGLRAFVVALNLKTGEEVWRLNFPDSVSERVDEFRGSWSTPILWRHGDEDILLLSLPLKLYAVSPRTGKEIWSCSGLGKLVYTSPLVAPETIVIMSGYHGPAIAVRAGGRGDVSASHVRWTHLDRKLNPQRVGSGVIVDGNIYILNETGVAWCLDLETGERKWQHRLGKAKGWSSMTFAAGHIYVANMDGTTFVLQPDPTECKVVAENSLAELTRGSLAFSNGQIFLRTYEHLYCIGDSK